MAEDGEPILSVGSENEFKKLKTVPAFSIHLLISLTISITGIVLAAEWSDRDRCKAYYVMTYLRVAFWLITFIFDHYVKRQHDILRLNGFHNFYRETHTHKSIPFYIVNLWSVTYLGVQTLMHEYYADDFLSKCIIAEFLSPVVYATVFSVTETLILAIVHGTYLMKVVCFNRARPLPDALRGSHSSGEGLVGLTQRNASYVELLEKQADMINYLKDHNLRLNQKLMQLNSQVRTVTLPSQI